MKAMKRNTRRNRTRLHRTGLRRATWPQRSSARLTRSSEAMRSICAIWRRSWRWDARMPTDWGDHRSVRRVMHRGTVYDIRGRGTPRSQSPLHHPPHTSVVPPRRQHACMPPPSPSPVCAGAAHRHAGRHQACGPPDLPPRSASDPPSGSHSQPARVGRQRESTQRPQGPLGSLRARTRLLYRRPRMSRSRGILRAGPPRKAPPLRGADARTGRSTPTPIPSRPGIRGRGTPRSQSPLHHPPHTSVVPPRRQHACMPPPSPSPLYAGAAHRHAGRHQACGPPDLPPGSASDPPSGSHSQPARVGRQRESTQRPQGPLGSLRARTRSAYRRARMGRPRHRVQAGPRRGALP